MINTAPHGISGGAYVLEILGGHSVQREVKEARMRSDRRPSKHRTASKGQRHGNKEVGIDKYGSRHDVVPSNVCYCGHAVREQRVS